MGLLLGCRVLGNQKEAFGLLEDQTFGGVQLHLTGRRMAN